MRRHAGKTASAQARRALSIAAVATLTLTGTSALAYADDKKSDALDEISVVEKLSADYLTKEFGLSEGDALGRVRDQKKHASTARELESKLGDRTSGSYIDQKRGKLIVNVTDEDSAKEVKGDNVEAKVVKTSAKEVTENRRQAEEKLGDKLTSSSLDTSRNLVVLSVPVKESEAAKKAVEGLKNVEVQATDNHAEPEYALTNIGGGGNGGGGGGGVKGGGDNGGGVKGGGNGNGRGGDNGGGSKGQAIYGGQEIRADKFMCSLGFNAKKGNQDVFITAGHCTGGGVNFTRNNKPLGKAQASNYPGADMGYATLEAGWSGKEAVDKYNGKAVVVKGSEEAPVGAAVCKSGRTTGWTCGTITAKNVTVNYRSKSGGTERITGLTQTNVCTSSGDSGGAWIAGEQAQGVHSGGNGNKIVDLKAGVCRHRTGQPNIAYFQPIKPILEKYQLTLKTRQ
ncbi:S1 family peptidase [Austwickia chelonae]|uniref:S1 family peptidase n=1 Tax=Austwickia chelonae TaxID=100225 RepID=UPI0013C35331|nr:S1 family peptidase [Austwickia chelonae]